MRRRVYVETIIPSFCVETRLQPDMVARRDWTKEWWNEKSGEYELVTSLAVVEELSNGDHPNKAHALALIEGLPLLAVPEEIGAIVDSYIVARVMPANPKGDALHLALASFHHCHFPLTWNCRHLANANKFEHIRHVNAEMGLFTPILTTPFELLGEGGE